MRLPAQTAVSYRINRQLSGWILPPLMIRAFEAHCHQRIHLSLGGEAGGRSPGFILPPGEKRRGCGVTSGTMDGRPATSPRASAFADNAGALPAIGRPSLREAIISHVVGVDTKRALETRAAWSASSLLMACWSRLGMRGTPNLPTYLSEAQAPQPDHNVHDDGAYIRTCRLSSSAAERVSRMGARTALPLERLYARPAPRVCNETQQEVPQLATLLPARLILVASAARHRRGACAWHCQYHDRARLV